MERLARFGVAFLPDSQIVEGSVTDNGKSLGELEEKGGWKCRTERKGEESRGLGDEAGFNVLLSRIIYLCLSTTTLPGRLEAWNVLGACPLRRQLAPSSPTTAGSRCPPCIGRSPVAQVKV